MKDRESLSISRSFADVVRKTTTLYFVLAPLTLIYLAIALNIAWNVQPVSQFFGMQKNHAESLLLDLCIAVLPLIGAITIYLTRLNRKKLAARASFLVDFEGRTLVQSATNPNLIYEVLGRDTNGRHTKLKVVWTADGRRLDGETYDLIENAGIKPLDQDRFLAG